MKLRHDVRRFLKEDRSPCGIHNRREWLGESGSHLERKVESLFDRLAGRQLKNGSWQDSVEKTILALEHILLLEGDRSVAQRAVDWLLERERPAMQYTSGDGSPYHGLFFHMPRVQDHRQIYGRFESLFNRGCLGFVKTGAALFYAGFFGTTLPKRVATAFASLDEVLNRRRGRWCSLYCSNNILRAYVTHRLRRDSTATARAVAYLERIQLANGSWPGTPFFYHTFHTVAGHDSTSARRQVERALPRIIRTQNPDGSWGRSFPSLTTYLVLDGLARQGVKLD